MSTPAKKTTTISKSEVDKLIKEEVTRMLATKRLKQIDTLLEGMKMEGDDCMEEKKDMMKEVEADGEMKVPSHAWTGEADGDVKYKPKFEKKGSHLLETDEDMENESFASKLEKIGAAIDAKFAGESEMTPAGGGDDDKVADDFSEIEISDDDKAPEDDKDMDTVEVSDDSKDEIEEAVVVTESGENSTTEKMELIKGKSPIQQAHKDTANKNYEKSTAVQESKKPSDKKALQESKQPEVAKNVLIESMETDKQKTTLSKQLIRMNKLAGL